MAGEEVVIAPEAPRPRGYGFLKKGNPFMTALCRRETHAAGKTLYVVSRRGTPVGLLAPEGILAAVKARELETRGRRSAAVERRDDAVRDEFEQAVLRLYPKIPAGEVADVLSRTLEKRSRRVGRTGTLDLDTKVRRAVAAHVRHRHTGYDLLVKGCTSKQAARDAIRDEASRVLSAWGAPPLPPRRGARQVAGAGETAGEPREGLSSPAAASGKRRSARPASRNHRQSARTARKTRKKRARAGGISSGPSTRGRWAAVQNRMDMVDSGGKSGAQETAQADTRDASRDSDLTLGVEVIVIEDSD